MVRRWCGWNMIVFELEFNKLWHIATYTLRSCRGQRSTRLKINAIMKNAIHAKQYYWKNNLMTQYFQVSPLKRFRRTLRSCRALYSVSVVKTITVQCTPQIFSTSLSSFFCSQHMPKYVNITWNQMLFRQRVGNMQQFTILTCIKKFKNYPVKATAFNIDELVSTKVKQSHLWTFHLTT